MVFNMIEEQIRKLLKNEETWCNTLKIRNPYLDSFPVHYTPNLPMFDSTAYKKYPEHAHVYDKLWVAKTQKKKCGPLETILQENREIEFPIFIKPRHGNKSASSKGCYKIKDMNELKSHINKKEVMWSEFYDGNETMTDFVMVNGRVTYQLTYIYSPPKNGFTDEWKYISPENKPPKAIEEWVNQHMKGFSGICNVQYRKDSIIEVGMRPARGGAYLQSTDNVNIIKNINNVIEKNVWIFLPKEQLNFKPYYSFKCFSKIPVFYLLPQHTIDIIMYATGAKKFYEYYFEPVGNDGCVFFQFLHEDFKSGMRLKWMLETLFMFLQLFFIIMFIIPLVLIFVFKKTFVGIILFIIIAILFSTKFINPLSCQYGLWKLFKQQFNIVTTKKEDIINEQGEIVSDDESDSDSDEE